MKSTTRVASFVLGLLLFSGLASAWMGSETCGNCHEETYNSWFNHGHHYTLSLIDSAAPEYPFQYNSGQNNVENPPLVNGTQLNWGDISYVIGGYYWSANFCDDDGYLVTGNPTDAAQWNIWNSEWTQFHPGEQLETDCAICHATGYDPSGQQGGMIGMAGSWAEDGVGCEACHGEDS